MWVFLFSYRGGGHKRVCLWGGNRDKGIEKTRRMVKREKYLREKE
jgi:hypothetical protein